MLRILKAETSVKKAAWRHGLEVAAVLVAPLLVACSASTTGRDATPPAALLSCPELLRGDLGGRPVGPRATPLRSMDDIFRLVEDSTAQETIAKAADGTPPGRVAVLVEMGGNSGSELRPVVEGIEPQHGRVRARWEVNPEGAMTDDLTHKFVLVHCEAGAIGGAKELPIEVVVPQMGAAPRPLRCYQATELREVPEREPGPARIGICADTPGRFCTRVRYRETCSRLDRASRMAPTSVLAA